MITEKQKLFFEKLKKLYGKDPIPSFEKIAHDFDFNHKNSVWQYFNKLKEAGLIKCVDNRFYINPEEFGAILYSSPVKAGFPSPAEDYIEKRVSLDQDFKLDSPETFVFKVSGDSMSGIGIYEDDMVIIKKQSSANSGDIVLANVDGDFTLKTFKKERNEVWLVPQNPNYPIIKPVSELLIFGIVTGVVRKI